MGIVITPLTPRAWLTERFFGPSFILSISGSRVPGQWENREAVVFFLSAFNFCTSFVVETIEISGEPKSVKPVSTKFHMSSARTNMKIQ